MDAGDSKGDSRLHLQVKNTFLDVQSTEDRPAVLKISAGWKETTEANLVTTSTYWTPGSRKETTWTKSTFLNFR